MISELILIALSLIPLPGAFPQAATPVRALNFDPQEAESYTCPMHLEMRNPAPGKCTKCAMALVPADPGIPQEFDVRVETTPRVPRPGEKVRLKFGIFNPKTGKQVKQFALMHDQFFHLFVVSRDMTEFQHIHPEQEADGSFTIETVLPQPGQYKLYSDFYPVEGTPQVIHKTIKTIGSPTDLMAGLPNLKPDKELVRIADGMRIELKIEPEEIIAGRPVVLKYRLADAKTGEPVQDLIPYLAAWGHTLILSEDQTDYLHSHPTESIPDRPDKSKLRGGPEVTFEALVPRPGIYRIWTQFLRGETLTTVSFTVKAKRL